MDISSDKNVYIFAKLLDSVTNEEKGPSLLLEHWRREGKLKFSLLLFFRDGSSPLSIPASLSSSGALPYWVALENYLEQFGGKFDLALRDIRSNSSGVKDRVAMEDKTNLDALIFHLDSFCKNYYLGFPSIEMVYEEVFKTLEPCATLLPKLQNLHPAIIDTNIKSIEDFLGKRGSIDFDYELEDKSYFVGRKP